jgi:hypothetical protein
MSRSAVAAVLLVTCLAPGAGAIPSACRPQVTDRRGDAAGTPSDPALDVLSADVLTTRTDVVAVIRTAELNDAGTESVGRLWRFLFTVPVNERRYWLEAYQGVDGTRGWVGRYNLPSEAGQEDGVSGEFAYATVDLNHDRREIRVTAPLKAFEKYSRIRPGMRMYDLAAESYRHWGVAGGEHDYVVARVSMGSTGRQQLADVATSTREYRAGAASCASA